MAILEYLCAHNSCHPQDYDHEYTINRFVGGCNDLRSKYSKMVYDSTIWDPLSTSIVDYKTTAKTWLGYLESLLEENSFVGGKKSHQSSNNIGWTYADVVAFECWEMNIRVNPSIAESYPKLQALALAVSRMQGVANYLSSGKRRPYQNGDSAYFDSKKYRLDDPLHGNTAPNTQPIVLRDLPARNNFAALATTVDSNERTPIVVVDTQTEPAHDKVAALTTTVNYFGNEKTPVVVVDNVLPQTDYLAMRDRLRNRNDYVLRNRDDYTEGLDAGVKFPGKFPGVTAPLDRSFVDPFVDMLLANSDVASIFPRKIFEQRTVTGFASILCSTWGLTNGVHSDHSTATSLVDGVVTPAAVFYFGFDGATGPQENTPRTGTGFYREKISGMERASSIFGNESVFCAEFPQSAVCPEHVYRVDDDDSDFYDETHRVVGVPNRMIVYSKDVLHKGWIGEPQEEIFLSCSPRDGRLAISLFFWADDTGPQQGRIVDRLDEL